NSMIAYVLLRLARIYGDDELEARAVTVLRVLGTMLERLPTSFGWALVALDFHLSPPRELAIVGPPDADVARAALGRWDPTAVVAFGPADGVPLLAGKSFVDGRPAVYVCERFVGGAPAHRGRGGCRRNGTAPADEEPAGLHRQTADEADAEGEDAVPERDRVHGAGDAELAVPRPDVAAERVRVRLRRDDDPKACGEHGHEREQEVGDGVAAASAQLGEAEQHAAARDHAHRRPVPARVVRVELRREPEQAARSAGRE